MFLLWLLIGPFIVCWYVLVGAFYLCFWIFVGFYYAVVWSFKIGFGLILALTGRPVF